MKDERLLIDATGAAAGLLTLATLQPALLTLQAALRINELWQAVTKILRSSLKFHNLCMALMPIADGPSILRTSNPVIDMRRYAAKVEAMAPVYAILARRPEARAIRLSDEAPIESLLGTPFYKNFMEPEGWRYGASLVFRDEDRVVGRLCLNRRLEQGDFTDSEMEVLEALHAQFGVAVQRVCRSEREREGMATHTSHSPLHPATLLLDERCAPIFHSQAAITLCELWRMGPQRARVLKPQFALPEEIRSACEDLATESRRRPRRGRLARAETVCTVIHAGGLCAHVQLISIDRSSGAKPHFLIHLSEKGLQEPEQSALTLLHRLTTTEQAVAKLVAWGLDNQQVATELRISVNTVRAHLHNIFDKIGVHCRGKLAVLLRLAVG